MYLYQIISFCDEKSKSMKLLVQLYSLQNTWAINQLTHITLTLFRSHSKPKMETQTSTKSKANYTPGFVPDTTTPMLPITSRGYVFSSKLIFAALTSNIFLLLHKAFIRPHFKYMHIPSHLTLRARCWPARVLIQVWAASARLHAHWRSDRLEFRARMRLPVPAVWRNIWI